MFLTSRKCDLTSEEAAVVANRFYSARNSNIKSFYLRPFSNEVLGHLSKHKELTIEVNDEDNSTKFVTFFVKTVFRAPNPYQKMIFNEESKFYCDLAPQLLRDFKSETFAAKSFFNNDTMIVLEDLRRQGFRSSSATGQLTPSQLKSAVVTVARLHAASMLLERRLQKPIDQEYPGLFEEKMYKTTDGDNWKWLVAGVEVVASVAQDLGLNAQHALEGYGKLFKKLQSPRKDRRVLCHGDLCSNNLLFKEQNNYTYCRLVDFQMVAYRPYIMDLVQLLYMNVDRESRKNLENELINLYHLALSNTLKIHEYQGAVVELQDVMNDFEDYRIHGLVTAVQCLPLCSMNEQLKKEFTKDEQKHKQYLYISRKDFVTKAMLLDHWYRRKVEGVVAEFVDFMENFKKNV